MTATPKPEESSFRELRLFLSGTFMDMQAEREHLVKHVFPEIRQLCRERGILFTDVDLRWGITESEARRGKIVSLCLDEVVGRRPYVLTLVGERYGWRPTHEDVFYDPDAAERYPWLPDAVERHASLMEIESLEAALHEPNVRERIRFYFKRSGIPRDISLPERIVEDLHLLDGFRERVRASGLPIREEYESLQQLGEWVRDDLLAILESLRPSEHRNSWLERERRGHEAFAATRRRAYVENKKILAHIDKYVAEGAWEQDHDSVTDQSGNRSLPLVITGESGAGKSALLSHWSEGYRRREPDAFLITHFVGATASSTDHIGLLRRIMQEIRERYGVAEEPPAEPDRIVREFPQWLAYTSGHPLVLVIDAINQLESRSESISSLFWLPEDFLPHVRLILSAIESQVPEMIGRRKWPELRVEPLSEKERREVARRFLGDYGKRLDKQQLQRVAQNFKSGNPLYLRTSLEELRVFGKYEKLNERIDHYLEAEDLGSLFDRVLERIEKDYGEGLVSTTMRLLWGARHGLNESELQQLIGVTKPRLTTLLQALDYHLMRRDGLLTFFHDHLRQAAQERYVPTEEDQQKTHQQLAEFFAEQPLEESRRDEEEPWQWKEAGAWKELEKCLTTIPLLCKLCREEKKYEALRYWQAIPSSAEKNIGEKYRRGLARLEKSKEATSLNLANMLETLGEFLSECAEYEEAEQLLRRALSMQESEKGSRGEVRLRTLTRLGDILRAKGDYEEAETILREALELIEKSYGPRHLETANGLDMLAALFYTTGKFKEAEVLCARALSIREQTLGAEHPDAIMSLSTLGAILLGQGHIEQAIALMERTLQLCEKAMGPEHPMTATSLNNVAAALRYREAYDEGIPLFQRAISINEGIFGSRHPEVAANLTNLAFFERKAGRSDEAERHYRQALEVNIAVFGENHSAVARTLTNLGVLLNKKGAYDEAERTYRKASSISEQTLGADHISTHRCLLNLAEVLVNQLKYEQAAEILRRSYPAMQRILGPNHPEVERLHTFFMNMPQDVRDLVLNATSSEV